MAKDPAFLFFPGDWLGGTMTFSRSHKGAYIDLLMAQFNHGHLGLEDIKAILGEKDFSEMWELKLKKKFKVDDNGLYYNQKLEYEIIKRKNYTDSRRKAREKSDEDRVRLYIVRDNVRITYKIGSSVNPVRRYNELNNQLAPDIMEDEPDDRDLSLVWYSDVVDRKEEKIVHNLFKDKRIKGEWFRLSNEDVIGIKQKYGGTDVERTMNRTIHRTENGNGNINKEEIGSEKVKQIANDVWKDQSWKEQICMGLSLTMEELKKWLAQFNSSVSADFIPDFNKGKYKKMSRGWIVEQQAKGRKVETGNMTTNGAPPLIKLNHGN